MNKVQPSFFDGTEYLRISQLPFDQAIIFREWMPETAIFTISHDEFVKDDCVKYDLYEYWFDLIKRSSRRFESSLNDF